MTTFQPRKFVYKNRQKNRTWIKPSNHSKLIFGNSGVRINKPLFIGDTVVSRLWNQIRRAARRSDKTRRRIWFSFFPHLPITRKVKGSRMGKGKGRLCGWFAIVNPGRIIVETRNLRYGRFKFFVRQFVSKLSPSTTMVHSSRLILDTSKHSPLRVRRRTFWS